MEAACIQQQQQQHGRVPIMRCNSIDNGLLASPNDPGACMYTNLVLPISRYQKSHRLVQLQPQSQPPLLPLPTATRPQYSSLQLLNRAARKPKSNHRKKEGTGSCRLRSEKLECCEDQRVVSDLVFTLSPHPSSLPLPMFCMRQRAAAKLS